MLKLLFPPPRKMTRLHFLFGSNLNFIGFLNTNLVLFTPIFESIFFIFIFFSNNNKKMPFISQNTVIQLCASYYYHRQSWSESCKVS